MSKNEAALRGLIVELKETFEAIANIPAPTVAAIEGACTGGGLELALACDLRVAAKSAFMSLPETHVGLLPDVGGTVRLSRAIGRARATDIVLSGRRVTAPEALEWGLVNRVTADSEALGGARALVTALRSAAPICTRAILEVLRNAPLCTFEAETNAGVRALLGAEAMEGVAAFKDKRPPAWAGR